MTLIIIGIVSVLVLPSTIKNYQERQYQTAKKVFISDLRSAISIMRAEGRLSGYRTTLEFTEALSKNLKIAKICDSNNLSDCFESSFKEVDEECFNSMVPSSGSGGGLACKVANYDLSEYKTSATLGKEYDSENTGIMTVKGMNAILTYDPNCNDTKENLRLSNNIPCVGAIFDTNGLKKPNILGKDVSTVNVDLFETCNGGIKIGDSCFLINSIQERDSEISYRDMGAGCDNGTHRASINELQTLFPDYTNLVEMKLGTSENPANLCFVSSTGGHHGNPQAVCADGRRYYVGGGSYVLCVR